MKLIIQIPCYNESQTLRRVVEDLPCSIAGIGELQTLVIDDGSVDGTAAAALAMGVDHVVRHNHNRGLAAAFATGLATCQQLGADIVVNTDGDHQYPGSLIAELVAPIVAGRADLTVGNRHPATDRRLGFTKRSLHRLGRWVISRLAGRDLPDPVSGFRAYSRQAIRRTHLVTNYSYTIESLLQASRRGLAIEFVDIDTNAPTRPSRLFRSMPHFVGRSAMTALRFFFMVHPLAIFGTLAIVLASVGVLPVLRFLWLATSGDGAGHLQSLVLGGTLIVLAAVFLAAALIGDLMTHNRRLLETILERENEPVESDRPRVGYSEFGPPRGRGAFTLLELLVVIGIIGILIAMLLPAVQAVRESARNVQCGNHVRQLSLAMIEHHSAHRHLPSGGWSKQWSGIPGRGGGRQQPGGWIYSILPMIEQPALHQLGGDVAAAEAGNGQRLTTPLAVLHCPSRRSAELVVNERGWHPHLHPQPILVARNDYAANGGGQLIAFGPGPKTLAEAKTFAWPDTKASTGVCFQRSEVQFRDITDGLSHTFLLGEKQIPLTRYVDGKDRGDNEGAYSGDDRDTIRYVGTATDPRYRPLPDAFLPEVEGGPFGSVHATGFQMALCDGSVRSVTYTIDLQTYANLGHRNDGKVVDIEKL